MDYRRGELIGKRDMANAVQLLTERYPLVSARRHQNFPDKYVLTVHGVHGRAQTVRTSEELQTLINTGDVWFAAGVD